MSIEILDDVGAPGVVAGVNIMLRQSTSQVMGQPLSDVAVYGMTALGYLGGHLNWGGNQKGFVKNIGISSAPMTMERIYDALKGEVGMTRRVNQPVRMRRVSTYNAPEFDNVRIARRGSASSKILV